MISLRLRSFRSTPHVGIGFCMKISNECSLFFSIHSGSFFILDIVSTISLVRPRLALYSNLSSFGMSRSCLVMFACLSLSVSMLFSILLPVFMLVEQHILVYNVELKCV